MASPEANVAAGPCNYGLNGTFVSKVPNNPIGQSAINHLRRYGVDTQFVARGGDRLGIYFLETGASMRASQVIYDRADAAIAEAEISDFDFDKIFDGASWFHTTGITPALSDKAAALAEAALKAAKAKGVTTSIDLNYRKKLWSKGNYFFSHNLLEFDLKYFFYKLEFFKSQAYLVNQQEMNSKSAKKIMKTIAQSVFTD